MYDSKWETLGRSWSFFYLTLGWQMFDLKLYGVINWKYFLFNTVITKCYKCKTVMQKLNSLWSGGSQRGSSWWSWRLRAATARNCSASCKAVKGERKKFEYQTLIKSQKTYSFKINLIRFQTWKTQETESYEDAKTEINKFNYQINSIRFQT